MTPTVSSNQTDDPQTGPPAWLQDYVKKAQANNESPQTIAKTVTAYGYPDLAQQLTSSGGGGVPDWLRQIGIAARGVGSGVENAGRMPGNLFLKGSQFVGSKIGIPPEQMANTLDMLARQEPFIGAIYHPGPAVMADRIGLPIPNTSGEQMLEKVGEGVGGAIPFAGGAGSIPRVLSMLLGGATGGGAGEAARQHGYGPLGQAVASTIAGSTPPAALTMGSGMIRRALAGSLADRADQTVAQQTMDQVVGDGGYTLGQVSKVGRTQAVERELRQSAGGAAPLRETLNQQGEQMGQRLKELADRTSPTGSVEAAGRTVQRGIEDGFVPRFRQQAEVLYSRAEQLVPDATPLVPKQTLDLFDAHNLNPYNASKVFSGLKHPYFQKWAGELSDQLEQYGAQGLKGVPFGLIRDFRSRLGDILTGKQVIQDLNMGDVKRLYGALSEDMRTTVAAQGGPAGTQAWDRAAKYWSAGTQRLENVLQPLLDKRTPELAFRALMSGTQDGATVLRTTMRSLTGDERKIVASTILRRLGKASAGAQDAAGDVFDPNRFLSQWATLAPQAKGALFSGVDATMPSDLNKIAKVAEIMRKTKSLGTPAMTPSSGFLGALLAAVSVGGGVGAGFGAGKGLLVGSGIAATKAGSVLGAKALAEKVFTNPKMMRWLAERSTLPAGVLGSELTRLSQIARQWQPEDRRVAEDLVRELGVVQSPIDRMSMDNTAVAR